LGNKVVKATGLTPGEEYFVMLDGSFGSDCEYMLTVESGLAACNIKAGQEQIECNSDGSYFVIIPVTGSGSGLPYRLHEIASDITGVKEVSFDDDGTIQLLKMGPYRAGHPYSIQVSGGVGLEKCEFIIKGEANC